MLNSSKLGRHGLSVPLLFDCAVLFQQFPVWIDLETRLFPVHSDDDFIVPFPIRVVFPFYPNDLSAGRLLINGLLDRGGKRLQFHDLTGLLGSLAIA